MKNCQDCQKEVSEKNRSGVCRPCYVKRVCLKKKKPTKFCNECKEEIYIRSRSGKCRKCYLSDYHGKEENKLRKSEISKAWAKSNPDRHREKSLAWAKANPIRCKQIRDKTQRSQRDRFTRARRRAEQRNLEWSISYEKFGEFIKQSCHYCHGNLNEMGAGLDRKDNQHGYTLDNVVPCCWQCNKMKNDILSFDEMVAAMKAVNAVRARKQFKVMQSE